MFFNHDRETCDCCGGVTLIADESGKTQELELPRVGALDIAFHHATEVRRALKTGKLVGTLDSTLVTLLDGMLAYREALARVVRTHLDGIGDELDKERALALADDLVRCGFKGSEVEADFPDKVRINLDSTFAAISAAGADYDANGIIPTDIEA